MYKKLEVVVDKKTCSIILYNNELKFIVVPYRNRDVVVTIDNLYRQIIEGIEIYPDGVVSRAVKVLRRIKSNMPDVYESNKLVIDTILEHYK